MRDPANAMAPTMETASAADRPEVTRPPTTPRGEWQAQPDHRIIDLSPLVLSVPPYSLTLNVKLPFTLWESDDITRHSTV
jgi:hypothetical protein